MIGPDGLVLSPPMAPGDVYLYAHGSGAIYLENGDGTWSSLVTLREARTAARAASESGATAWVAGDDAPLAVDTLSSLGDPDVHLEPFVPEAAPQAWLDDSTPLMQAVREGRGDLATDLIERGADVHHADDGGFTALHHAAVAGDHRIVDALLSAGARVDVRSLAGHRPADLASFWGHPRVADRLGGPPADSGAGDSIRFGRGHLFFERLYAFLIVLALLFGALVALDAPPVGLMVALGIIGLGFVAGPGTPEILRARPPHGLEADTLRVRHLLGRAKQIDLNGVTGAELTSPRLFGSEVEAEAATLRYLLLAHPQGRKLGRRTRNRLRLSDSDDFTEGVIIVPIPARSAAEVLMPVGGILESRGVPLLPGYRGFLRRIRWRTGLVDRNAPRALHLATVEADDQRPPNGPDPATAPGAPAPEPLAPGAPASPDARGESFRFPASDTAMGYVMAVVLVLAVAGVIGIPFAVGGDTALPLILFSVAVPFLIAIVAAFAVWESLEGSPRALIGDELVYSRPFRSKQVFDLADSDTITATKPRWRAGNRYAPASLVWHVVVVHPRGRKVEADRLRELGVHGREVNRWERNESRVLVMTVADSAGVPLTRSLARGVGSNGGGVHKAIDRAIRVAEVELGIIDG